MHRNTGICADQRHHQRAPHSEANAKGSLTKLRDTEPGVKGYVRRGLKRNQRPALHSARPAYLATLLTHTPCHVGCLRASNNGFIQLWSYQQRAISMANRAQMKAYSECARRTYECTRVFTAGYWLWGASVKESHSTSVL